MFKRAMIFTTTAAFAVALAGCESAEAPSAPKVDPNAPKATAPKVDPGVVQKKGRQAGGADPVGVQ